MPAFCAQCALQMVGNEELCIHHHTVYADDWAKANRILCDFFHRGKVPARLTPPEREDDFWGHIGDGSGMG